MSLRVLIVDDSPAMRAFVRKSLQNCGLPIESIEDAADGVEGLAKVREGRVNLILSDVNMPNMDGEEFVKTLKSDKDLRDIPVIMVTTDNSTQRVLRLRQLGAHGYLCKPFTTDLMKQKLLSVLGS